MDHAGIFKKVLQIALMFNPVIAVTDIIVETILVAFQVQYPIS